jgi:hypothetical protein
VFRPPNSDFMDRLVKIRSERVSEEPQPQLPLVRKTGFGKKKELVQ